MAENSGKLADGVVADQRLFCGQVTASISHEIKNVLAIVNENAGLLDDFAKMAATAGQGVEPDRVTAGCANIARQVRRANEIVGLLNRFAHSADQPRQEVELNETVDFFVALARRTAGNAGVSLQVIPAGEPVRLQVALLPLLQLWWRLLAGSLAGERAAGGGGGELSLQVVAVPAPALRVQGGGPVALAGSLLDELLAVQPAPCSLQTVAAGWQMEWTR